MRSVIFWIGMFLIQPAGAQVELSSQTFEKACRQAAKEKKVVMVVMESSDCEQCNDVAMRGLRNPAAYSINAMAVSLLAKAGSPTREKLQQQFLVPESAFGVWYFNAQGELIHQWKKSSTAANDYVAQTTIAYKKRNMSASNLSQLEQDVMDDPTSSKAVLQLYEARKERGKLFIEMANEYAMATTPAWKDSAEIIRTLIGLTPILGTYADSMMRYQNRTLFNKLWFEQPYNVRVETNRQIIALTGTQAITERNEKLAQRNANFAAAILDNASPLERTKTSQTMMAVYFKNVNDTNQYIKRVEWLMTKYYLRLDADSIRRADDTKMRQSFTRPSNVQVDTIRGNGSITSATSYAPKAQFIVKSINTFCWNIYKMKPNSYWTERAIGWAYHGTNIYDDSEIYDTYARLLYMHGKVEDAITAQEKAITIQQEKQFPASNYAKVLEAMKAGKPIVDLK